MSKPTAQPTSRPMNALEFFQKSSGVWKSQRTTHHLAFKRAEKGGSEITVDAYSCENPKIAALCEMHAIDPKLAIGGAYVSWQGTMQWDKEDGETHAGETVFALVPDDETGRSGRLLREKGYAEIVPVVGRYEMDEEDGLVLITEYETMSFLGGETFDRVHQITQCPKHTLTLFTFLLYPRLDQKMNVIRHHAGGEEFVSLAIEMLQRVQNDGA